jgi:hypothetical protein
LATNVHKKRVASISLNESKYGSSKCVGGDMVHFEMLMHASIFKGLSRKMNIFFLLIPTIVPKAAIEYLL